LANQEGEKLLFATDTYYLRNRFAGLTHIMLEINYCAQTLNSNVESGTIPQAMKIRLIKSHLSLENAVNFFKANDLSQVKGIWILHLSDNNADEILIKQTIQKTTGKPVFIC